MKIIIGLGNPGAEYKNTRHNVGHMAVDALAQQLGLPWEKKTKLGIELASDGDKLLVKSLSFMNESGQPANALLSYYKLLPKTLGLLKIKGADLTSVLTVIHDDVDIELEKYKIATNSSSAGHRGVQSIIDHLKTKNFRRVRIGVKTEMMEKIPTDKFVLQKFSANELTIIDKVIRSINTEILKSA